MATIITNWQNWAWSAGVIGGAALIALLIYRVVYSALRRVAARTTSIADESFIRHSAHPAKLIFPVVAIFLVTPGLPLEHEAIGNLRHALVIILIGAVAWLLVSLLNVIEDLFAARYRTDVSNNLQARRIKTQVKVLRRISTVVVVVVGLAAALMTFPSIWNIGAGLFASAGAAGLVIGLAARPTLSNLLAGIQIALTEPIRLDDVVIVEGEWGWIEDIQTTYVVVRIWDLRRLVLPLSYFIEKPFQNWTRESSEILGTVFLNVDYTVPVEEVRRELHQILKSSEMWDGKVWNLQVTNATEHTVELRALMSAVDSGKAWDLRCYVRERLIGFLQERYPDCLPRMRAEVSRNLAAPEASRRRAPAGPPVGAAQPDGVRS
jgi:small-conductance mechanosensitive channel